MASFWVTLLSLPTLPLFALYLAATITWRWWGRCVRKFDLKGVMLLHNITCAGMSAIAFYLFTSELYAMKTLTSRAMTDRLQQAFDVYWFTKLVELLDTVFMMLRRSARQVSLLHVYHHSAMLLLSDYARSSSPWPPMGALLGMNAFVHVFVYGYYAVSLKCFVGENWKRRLTQLQIVQFLIGLMFCTYGYVNCGFCPYSIGFGASMLLMFSNFYYQAYVRKKPDTKELPEDGVAKMLKVKKKSG